MIYKVKHGFSYTLPISGKSIFISKGTPAKHLKITSMSIYDKVTNTIHKLPYFTFSATKEEWFIELNVNQFAAFVEKVTCKQIWSELNEYR